jgi:Calx-beta domain
MKKYLAPTSLASVLLLAATHAVAGGSVFNITNAAIAEGTGGASNLVLTVNRTGSGALEGVSFASNNVTAVAGVDYTAASGTLSFPIGTLTQTVSVPITTDSTVEGDETFTVSLNSPTGAGVSIGTGVATATINNDDTAIISVNTPSIAEGNIGNTPLPFVVSISNPVQGAVSFTYTAANGNNVNPLLNATLADNDFVASTGSVSFASDSTAALTVNVPIVGDTDVEANQGLLLNLSALVLPATIAPASITFAASGAGTINNDDGAILSIANASIAEGNAGSSNLVFTVNLSASNKNPVTVQYASTDGTAAAGSDYSVTNGTLTFPALSLSQTITVPITGENIVEANEAFTITLSAPVGASLGTSTATGTINNDDSATLSLNSLALAEGNAGNTAMNFTATLSNPVQGAVGATLNTSDGNNATATLNATVADNDYIAISNAPFNLASGVTQTVPVQIVGDTDVEPNQGFRLTLSNLTLPAGIPAGSVTLGTATGNGTINNDDSTALSIAPIIQLEGNSGTSVMNLTVTLPVPNKDPVTVNFATSDGTATAGVDYVARSGTLTFPSNSQSQQIAITVNGDAIYENDETFTVTLSAPTGATIATPTAVATITDDDSLGLSIADVTQAEGTIADTTMTFTVALAGISSLPVTVSYASSNGSAVAPGDYTPVSGSLTFAPGESSKTISVTIRSDRDQEGNETFALTLSNPNPGPPRVSLTRAVATGTIGNDDQLVQAPGLDWRGMSLLLASLLLLGGWMIRRDGY